MEEEVVPGIRIRLRAVNWSQIRGGGPGGQHVNTTASTIVIRVPMWGIEGLDGAGRDRLRQMLGARLTQEGEIVLRCGTERDAQRNREIVWERLRYLVKRASIAPRTRRATKPSRGSVQRRLTAKSQQSQKKKRRSERPSDE